MRTNHKKVSTLLLRSLSVCRVCRFFISLYSRHRHSFLPPDPLPACPVPLSPYTVTQALPSPSHEVCIFILRLHVFCHSGRPYLSPLMPTVFFPTSASSWGEIWGLVHGVAPIVSSPHHGCSSLPHQGFVLHFYWLVGYSNAFLALGNLCLAQTTKYHDN